LLANDIETDLKNVERIHLNSVNTDEALLHAVPYLFNIYDLGNSIIIKF
jgi:hypothetical protein